MPAHYQWTRRGYDPIYAYSRWENRNDRNWERSRRENFSYYRDNEASRPPQTWAAMNLRSKDERRGSRDNYEFAKSPVVAKRSEQMAASEAPPKRREARGNGAGTKADRATDAGKRSAEPKAEKRKAPKEQARQQRQTQPERKAESPQRAKPPRKEARPAPEQMSPKAEEARSKKDKGEDGKKKK